MYPIFSSVISPASSSNEPYISIDEINTTDFDFFTAASFKMLFVPFTEVIMVSTGLLIMVFEVVTAAQWNM